ncbi:MAG: hypothetical protein N2748_00845, partial [candidate division WOR-3 bacterium]|nr:hypothetical protein [candidate division WOR-3 bacterium]
MIREPAELKDRELLGPDLYSFWLNAPKIAAKAKPGQFVLVQITELLEPFLSRPMSIADVDTKQIRIIFRVRGKGTVLLKDKCQRELIYLFGPLGKPVKLVKNKKIVLCAGGVGIAPLL